MTKSELIERLAQRQMHLMQKDVELSVKLIIDRMSDALESRERVEIRGFGSFSNHERPARLGRNPKTGESVEIPAKTVPHFKPGKELRERVNADEAETPRNARRPGRLPRLVGGPVGGRRREAVQASLQ